MSEPKIIKEFPGKAVEQWRRSHGGFLPTEQDAWIEHLVMAIRASAWPKITDTELDDLKRLALLGVGVERGKYVAPEVREKLTDAQIMNAAITAADALDATRVSEMRPGGWHPTTIFDGDAGLLRFGRLVEALTRGPQPSSGDKS